MMRLQRSSTTVAFFVSAIVLASILTIMRQGMVCVPILPKSFANNEAILSTDPPLRGSSCNTHKFQRRSRITEYEDDVSARLATLVERRATATDPDLIRLIVDMLDPPSSHVVKIFSRQLYCTPQCLEVDKILQRKRGGFYVECGAFDGERASNTLYLEQKRGWTGLLVEMDPYFYTQLLGKSRRSWSINACLSPHPYITQIAYKEASGQGGKLITAESRQSSNSRLVPCFPLHALLVALNQSTVDYFSLDVEGFELEILRTIPFNQINFSVLSVEYVHGSAGKRSYVDFMNQQDYDMYKDIRLHHKGVIDVDDFIFIKKTLNYRHKMVDGSVK